MRRHCIVFALLLGFASGAYAHPKLIMATPAADATVSKADRVELRFSEKLMPAFTGADLTMTGPGSDAHAMVKVASATTFGKDGQTLIVTPSAPLAAGRYSVAWHAVSTDTHRVTGNYTFTVK